MSDKIQHFKNSIIQHGKENDRIYLMKFSQNDYPEIIDFMENLAQKEDYSKIIAKVPNSLQTSFLSRGYLCEAKIKNFFINNEDALFLCKYYSSERKKLINKAEITKIKKICKNKKVTGKEKIFDIENFTIRILKKSDIFKITTLFKSVFNTYPFPVFDENYILKTMKENVVYFGVLKKNKLIAISSSEMDLLNKNTEMTDFATLPEYRGKNLSYHLLKKMETYALKKNIKTFYTIARARNIAINTVFAKNDYLFGGTLINNTNICGNIETMNIWYKTL